MFETTRSRAPTRFFLSRVLQPFVVNLLGTTVYRDMRRMEELFRNSKDHRDDSRAVVGGQHLGGGRHRKALEWIWTDLTRPENTES